MAGEPRFGVVNEPEYAAAGIPFDGAGKRIDRLEESLGIITDLLARQPVHHAGASYRIDGLDLDVVPGGTGVPPLLSAFVTLRLTDRRRAATEHLIAARGWTGTTVEAVWDMPTVLVGSATQIRDDLDQRRERFGLSYLVTSDTDLPTLETAIAAR